jgi:hypothetical protein
MSLINCRFGWGCTPRQDPDRRQAEARGIWHQPIGLASPRWRHCPRPRARSSTPHRSPRRSAGSGIATCDRHREPRLTTRWISIFRTSRCAPLRRHAFRDRLAAIPGHPARCHPSKHTRPSVPRTVRGCRGICAWIGQTIEPLETCIVVRQGDWPTRR